MLWNGLTGLRNHQSRIRRFRSSQVRVPVAVSPSASSFLIYAWIVIFPTRPIRVVQRRSSQTHTSDGRRLRGRRLRGSRYREIPRTAAPSTSNQPRHRLHFVFQSINSFTEMSLSFFFKYIFLHYFLLIRQSCHRLPLSDPLLVDSWFDMERLWHHVYTEELKCHPEEVLVKFSLFLQELRANFIFRSLPRVLLSSFFHSIPCSWLKPLWIRGEIEKKWRRFSLRPSTFLLCLSLFKRCLACEPLPRKLYSFSYFLYWFFCRK